VQITLPYYPEKLANRELGTLQSIDKEGNLSLLMEKGREVSFNIHQHSHLDHGYAVTRHSSQGESVGRVLVHIDSDLACKGLINTRLAYVSVSRAREDALIFTNDASTLGQELSRDVSHASVLNPVGMRLEQELAFSPDVKIANSHGLSMR
jgi:ATP-dependent exoDNAse (exonuclease V) alpha subunit